MNFAIEHISAHFSHLVITPRKKVLKHSLVSVRSGLVLVKLGKLEYAIEANQSIWIPFDCLTSLTYFPNTQIEQVDFSIRLNETFPQQAGYVKHTALSNALIDKLATLEHSAPYKKELLAVLKHEITAFKPQLNDSPLTQRVNKWNNAEESTLSQEQTLVMVMREAKKRMQSGQKKPKVIDDLFAGKSEEFELLCFIVFGQAL